MFRLTATAKTCEDDGIAETGGREMSRRPVFLRLVAATVAAAAVLGACATDDDFEIGHEWLGDGNAPIAISHEGVLDSNGRITVGGFIQAYDMGFRYMETDLRRIASGELVAVHDVAGGVESQKLSELPDVTPTAAELLGAPELADVRWNFELKGGDVETANKLTEVLDATGSVDRVCVSFGVTVSVSEIRGVLPDGICMCATLLERARDWDIFAGLFSLGEIDDRVVCTQMASEPFAASRILQVGQRDVRRAHERGLAIHVYDVLGLDTSEEDVERWLDIGVDGIITDDHEVLRDVFVERGIWPDQP